MIQAGLQQYMNQELADVQAGFRKGRGTRDQIANIHCIIEKARGSRKNICFIDYSKALTLWITTDCVAFCPYPHQNLIFVVILMTTILTGVE